MHCPCVWAVVGLQLWCGVCIVQDPMCCILLLLPATAAAAVVSASKDSQLPGSRPAAAAHLLKAELPLEVDEHPAEAEEVVEAVARLKVGVQLGVENLEEECQGHYVRGRGNRGRGKRQADGVRQHHRSYCQVQVQPSVHMMATLSTHSSTAAGCNSTAVLQRSTVPLPPLCISHLHQLAQRAQLRVHAPLVVVEVALQALHEGYKAPEGLRLRLLSTWS